ncbi:MAG: response regulator [Anaerolineae bacterium]|nr:response regulator [Anaerolineae bacterium]
MSNKTVLIIEDEGDAAELFAEMMRVSGFRVLKVSNSAPAIDLISSEKPDLIILDIMMPGISGLDILHHMHHDPALTNIPVVVVSAKACPLPISNAAWKPGEDLPDQTRRFPGIERSSDTRPRRITL